MTKAFLSVSKYLLFRKTTELKSEENIHHGGTEIEAFKRYACAEASAKEQRTRRRRREKESTHHGGTEIESRETENIKQGLATLVPKLQRRNKGAKTQRQIRSQTNLFDVTCEVEKQNIHHGGTEKKRRAWNE
jgi:alcohol dehydrogenase YqhD (iron-dependent ADH family)